MSIHSSDGSSVRKTESHEFQPVDHAKTASDHFVDATAPFESWKKDATSSPSSAAQVKFWSSTPADGSSSPVRIAQSLGNALKNNMHRE